MEDLQHMILAGGLAYLRMLTAFATLGRIRGFLGVPGMSALATVLAAFLLFAARPADVAASPEHPPAGLILIFIWRNAAIGILTAAPYCLVLEALMMAARLADTLRGSQYAEQLLPGTESRNSSLESAAGLGIALLFFSAGAYQPFLKSLLAPPIFADSASGELVHPSGITGLLALSSFSIQTAVRLVAPLAIVLVLFELTLAMLSRLGTKLPLAPEMQGFRLLLGLAVSGVVVGTSLVTALRDSGEGMNGILAASCAGPGADAGPPPDPISCGGRDPNGR